MEVYGIVCYTGSDTKLGMNEIKPAVKLTSIEVFLNRTSFCIFIAQIVIAIIAASISYSWELYKGQAISYLELNDMPIKDLFEDRSVENPQSGAQ
jgi:magnesium-transporting ATPase (P-type)